MKKLENIGNVYVRKARIYPVLILFFPVLVVFAFYVIGYEKYFHFFSSAVAYAVLTFFFANLGRDKGKMKEKELWKNWGGIPTTQILRYSNNYLDNITKERYHKKLGELLSDVKIPTKKSEIKKPDKSDEFYTSGVNILRTKTRDKTKYPLVFTENVNYGFRRNLWGLKSIAIVESVIFILSHFGYMLYDYFVNSQTFSINSIILLGVLVFVLLLWIFWINTNWVKIAAFAYAERLLETLNDDNNKKT